MPQKGDTQITDFVKGYITEASPLNFPEGASLDEVNMKLKRDGTRERRLGLDYEDSYALQDTGQTALQLAASRQRAFVWPTPSGFTDVEIGVIQIGTKLYFIDLFTENPSDNVLNSGNAFDASTASSVIDNTAVFDFALINNNLIVVSSGLDTPFILYYDGDTDTVSWDTARIKIRDLYGVTDGLDVDERPTSLTDAHEYNLRNQGWNTNIITKNGAEVLEETFNELGKYPSNSDVWTLGKIADVTDADVDKYDADTLERNSFDIGRAPRGHFITDLYNRGFDRESLTGLTMPTADREVRRVSTVASMGGRLFFSGINSKIVGRDVSPKLSGAVLYSQIASSDDQLVKCYQEADPTSPTSNDLVETDGGVIFITEASNIIKIQNTQGSVLVFAENGVWEIRGDEGGFRATSFQVNKVSNIGVIARESIIDANGTIYFWGKDGIFTMTPNQLGTGYDTVNITLQTIQSAFNTLPDFTKRGVKAFYDVSTNSIRWLFNLDSDNTIDIPAPNPPAVELGEAAEVVSSFIEPKVVQISSTKALIVYRNAAATQMKCKVATIDATTLAVTLGAENDIITSTSLGGHTLDKLSSTKILLTYFQSTNCVSRVLNISGDTVTAGTAYTVNTVHQGSAYTAPLRSEVLTNGDVVITFINSASQAVSAQVLQISSSDVVTFGTVATSTDTSLKRPCLAMMSDTSGVILADTSAGTRLILKTFTISGTTISISGTTNTFLNATQMSGRGYSNTSSFVNKASSSTVNVVTALTADSPSVSSVMYSFTGAISGSTITATTGLEQADETGTVPVSVQIGNQTLIVYRKNAGGGDFTGRLLVNNNSSPTPTASFQLDVGSDTTYAFPEVAILNEASVTSFIIAYETGSSIKAIAGNV